MFRFDFRICSGADALAEKYPCVGVAKCLRTVEFVLACIVVLASGKVALIAADNASPNVILVMADDQGWGETGYYDHPVLQTPNLDAMSTQGLRFDRFYAAAPVCSPTRASVLTGRTNQRTGVESHGFALRLQEKTLAQALRDKGYQTGHFGKWHLNGLRGPGVPVLETDRFHPGHFGFNEWLSVTNFFDRDPIMGRRGKFEEFEGDSSEIIIDEALKFIQTQAQNQQPFFTVIWYGTPHSPFVASDKDRAGFGELDKASQNHYGELVAMDRSIGALRDGLRSAGIADNTLLWFCSDNGGLPGISPATTGGLRGFKGSLFEGGLRVPSIIEWPEGIANPRVTKFPASTMDIFPTIAEIVGLPADAMLQPQDGTSLLRIFAKEPLQREKPIGFYTFGESAWIDGDYKLLHVGKKGKQQHYELYQLNADPSESDNLLDAKPEVAERMKEQLAAWLESVEASVAGQDYPENQVDPSHPEPRFWTEAPEYKPFFDAWRSRPEYESRLRRK